MCQSNNKEILHNEVYTNIQTGEVLDWDRVKGLKGNAMLKAKPALWIDWDFEKNNELGLDIWKYSKGQRVNAFWICKECKSHFEETIYMRIRTLHCPYCKGKLVNNTNSLASKKPELASEFHPTLNGEITPHDIYYRKDEKYWWLCPVCSSGYHSNLYGRQKEGYACPYCSGKVVNETNSLATLFPELAKQWHPTKNGKLTPYDFSYGVKDKVWWLGTCGHDFLAPIGERTNRNQGCPYCAKSNTKVLKDFNDMWTTNPELAKLLANPKDGYKYTQNSTKKVDWTCPSCNEVIKNKNINTINNQGLSCANCSDGVSYPEKVMYQLLKQLKVEFEVQKTFNWSQNRKYDFYINNSRALIIETHGKQHYEKSNRGRSLKEEQENDKLKYELAIKNDVDLYIVIDCRYSKFDYIKDNIVNSVLSQVFDLSGINWDSVNFNSQSSLNYEMLKLWNEGLSLNEISEIVKISNVTIGRVLRNFEKLNLCKYDGNRGRRNTSKSKSNKIFQFDTNYNLIKAWKSALAIEEELGINNKYIYNAVNLKQKTLYGYIWRYEKDLIGWSVPIHNIE